ALRPKWPLQPAARASLGQGFPAWSQAVRSSFGPSLFGASLAARAVMARSRKARHMHTSFADQLSQLVLTGFTISNPVSPTDLPGEDAVTQTLGAVWSDLFALFTD